MVPRARNRTRNRAAFIRRPGALSPWGSPGRMARRTPDMTGEASEIDDPMLLYVRIGFRIYLAYRDGARSPEELYKGLQRGGAETAAGTAPQERRAPVPVRAPFGLRAIGDVSLAA